MAFLNVGYYRKPTKERSDENQCMHVYADHKDRKERGGGGMRISILVRMRSQPEQHFSGLG